MALDAIIRSVYHKLALMSLGVFCPTSSSSRSLDFLRARHFTDCFFRRRGECMEKQDASILSTKPYTGTKIKHLMFVFERFRGKFLSKKIARACKIMFSLPRIDEVEIEKREKSKKNFF